MESELPEIAKDRSPLGGGRLALVRAAAAVCLTATLLLASLGLLAPWAEAAAEKPSDRFRNRPAPVDMAAEAAGGREGPFYPSSASTRNNAPVSEEVFTGSQNCGRAGCHPDVAKEWSSSAHRFSGYDNPWYRASFEATREAVGPIPARWCGGCHTPALLLSGNQERPAREVAETPAGHAGIGCVVCHSITRVKSTLGQGGYELTPPGLYALGSSRSALVRALQDVWVRIDPEPHRRAFRPILPGAATSSELCSTCHSAHVEEPVNAGFRRYSVFEDYFGWRRSSYSGMSYLRANAFPPVQGCVDCHMPLVSSRDAGAKGGRFHSHRFAAANTALPTLHGDGQQLEAVRSFLQARQVTLDLFALAMRRPPGDVKKAEGNPGELKVFAPLDRLPATVRRGESIRLDVVVRNRGVGHFFPGGKSDLADCWLEVTGDDGHGRTFFWNGRPEEDAGAPSAAARFGTLWLDEHSRTIERHEVWNLRIDLPAALIPATLSSVVRYRLEVPPDAGDAIQLTARLYYRKFRPEFTRWAFAALSLTPPRVPLTTLAESSVVLKVVDAQAELPDMEHPSFQPQKDVSRFNDYGSALQFQGDRDGARAAFRRASELAPGDANPLVSLANVYLTDGDSQTARTLLHKALELDPRSARAHFYLSIPDRDEGLFDSALSHLRAASSLYPADAATRRVIGTLLFSQGDFRAAAAELEQAVALEPQDYEAQFALTRAYEMLREPERAKYHLALYNRLKPGSPAERDLVREYLKSHPEGLPGGRSEHH